jgi:ADP-heptose:LPS heptosyltransferase
MRLLTKTSGLKLIDAAVGGLACRAAGLLRHLARRPALAPNPDLKRISRILIIRPGGMGDMLMLLPVIRAVIAAGPQVRIDIVCEKRNFEVLKLAGLDRYALLYDTRPLSLLRRLLGTPYDVAIDTEQFHNFSAILAWLSGAPVRIGFRLNPARLHLYTHLCGYDVDGHELDQFARLLSPLGIAPRELELQAYLGAGPTPAPSAHAIGALLAQDSKPIAFAPGTSDPYKQWHTSKWKVLARELHARGYTPLVLGGKDEIRRSRRLAGDAPVDATMIDLTGKLSLIETAAVMKQAAAFIGSDSGLAHLARALGVPTVVLFGPSDPRKWSRPSPEHVVVHKALPCSPCAVFGYRKWCREIPCMSSITVDEVLEAINGLLKQ